MLGGILLVLANILGSDLRGNVPTIGVDTSVSPLSFFDSDLEKPLSFFAKGFVTSAPSNIAAPPSIAGAI